MDSSIQGYHCLVLAENAAELIEEATQEFATNVLTCKASISIKGPLKILAFTLLAICC